MPVWNAYDPRMAGVWQFAGNAEKRFHASGGDISAKKKQAQGFRRYRKSQ